MRSRNFIFLCLVIFRIIGVGHNDEDYSGDGRIQS